jgi:hypothetical protein
MDPITTVLASGAAFILTGAATEAVKDAYKALKDVLSGRLLSLANLEEDPADEDYRKATGKELQNKALAVDPVVQEKANDLAQAIEREPPERLAPAAIDVVSLRAARDIIVKRLRATENVSVRDVTAEQGTIDIQDVSAGPRGKN